MYLWRVLVVKRGKKHKEINPKELLDRLTAIQQQHNVELIQLCIQSIIDELTEE